MPQAGGSQPCYTQQVNNDAFQNESTYQIRSGPMLWMTQNNTWNTVQ